jgi:hypothetical protein
MRVPLCQVVRLCSLLGLCVALCQLSRYRLRVTGRCPLPFRLAWDAKAEAPPGWGRVLDLVMFSFFPKYATLDWVHVSRNSDRLPSQDLEWQNFTGRYACTTPEEGGGLEMDPANFQ